MAGVGLSSVSGFVMHVVLSIVFLVWAGPNGFGGIDVPVVEWIVYAALALAAVTVVGLLVPAVRAKIREVLLPAIGRSIEGVAEVIRRPGKVVQLLGGSALITLTAIVGLYLSTLAFDGGLSLATVGACYLLGSAVASAVPVPGGLGAVEAALVAGLVALGMDNTVAIPAVFLYRLCTFWLPILPAWLAFRWLQQNAHI